MEERKLKQEAYDEEVRELIIPIFGTVVVYDGRGNRVDDWSGGRIVIEYHASGTVARVLRPPPVDYDGDL